MRRPQRADLPLVHRVVRDAVDANLAVAPGLCAGPFNAIVKVPRFAWRPAVDHAWRTAGAARIDTHTDVAVRHPLLRVDQFPVLVIVAGSCERVRDRLDQPRPLALVALPEIQTLGIRSVTQYYRVFAVSEWAEHIRAQDGSVVRLDRGVPVDFHSVTDSAFHLVHG